MWHKTINALLPFPFGKFSVATKNGFFLTRRWEEPFPVDVKREGMPFSRYGTRHVLGTCKQRNEIFF